VAVTILHTADWQIGKPFNDFEGDTGAALREARFETVKRIAALASERGVDAVLVAGDVFDTAAIAERTLHRLVDALAFYAGPWVLLPGNHDAAQPAGIWDRLKRNNPPANIRLATAAEPLLLADGRLAVLPAPLTRRHEATDLTEWWDRAETPPGAVRVGLAHGSVTERLPEAAEAQNPIAHDRADRARLDYLALGDWHGTLEIAPRTWYAGTPEPDRFKDNDPGHVLIVTLDGPGVPPRVERVPAHTYSWHSLEHSVADADDLAALDAALAALPAPHDRRVVSLAVRGTLSLAGGRALDTLLERWSGRLRALRVDRSDLRPEPTDDDLDAIDQQGFVRAAIDELKRRAGDPADPEAAAARDALRLAYTLHHGLPEIAP
jgi:DNA repair exonuclease SbcCD nuclease subunit